MQLTTIQLLTLKVLGIAIAFASAYIPYAQSDPDPAIDFWASYYGIDASTLRDTIEGESGFDPRVQSHMQNAKDPGGREDSWGLCQIHLPDHPDITKEQAQDPNWCLPWMANQIAQGKGHEWTCYPHGCPKRAQTVLE